MRKYIPGSGRFDTSFKFGFDTSQFGNIEFISALDMLVQKKVDVSWSFGAGGSVWAAPLVKDGVVYFGAMDRNFYALDANTGRELWRFSTGDIIISSAASGGDVIYFGSFDGCLYALTTEGKLLWKFRAGDKIFSDPFIWNDKVYFGSRNGKVYCLDKSKGKPVWVFPTGGPISFHPLVHAGVLYAGSVDKNLYAIDAGTGALKWKFPAAGAVRYSPAVWGDWIVFGSLDGVLRGVDRNGRLAWKFASNDGISTIKPVVWKDRIIFGSRDMNFYAVDKHERLLWKYRAKGYPNDMVIFNDFVYAGVCENNVFILDPETGRELWTFPTNGLVIRITEHEGKLFFGCWDCNVYAITPEGKLLWKFHTSMSSQSPILPEEETEARTFEVVWAPEAEAEEKPKDKEKEFSDYGEVKSDYASGIGSDYLGKKKKGY